MSILFKDKFELELTINNNKVDFTELVIGEINIHESVLQSLPTMDIVVVNDGSLIEENPLVDGSQVDLNVRIEQNSTEEEFRFESLLWSHEIDPVSEGFQITLHCVMSAPDFFEGRIESVDGSSFDVFNLMAERSRMQLIADPSIDRQVWLRPGIRGNIWLNDVINHSWSSPESVWVYAVTRNRELLKYNLQERASRNTVWDFQQIRENFVEPPAENTILFSYPRYSSQSGFLNTFFGYGRQLSNFDLEVGDRVENRPQNFTKRTNFMNLNNSREVSQRVDSLGYGNAKNVHENYFDAYAQNMRLKSFYSVNVQFLSTYFRNVRLLDRVSLNLNNESTQTRVQNTYTGDYFVEKMVTTIKPSGVTRRFNLVREGYNSTVGFNSK